MGLYRISAASNKLFHPPVHCSWINQVEQWFSILQRKRLKISDFTDKKVLSERLQAFISEWNTKAHPFITCGVWEAVYILDGLLKNLSDIQPYSQSHLPRQKSLSCNSYRMVESAILEVYVHLNIFGNCKQTPI